MAHKTFISYKYSEAKDLRDKIIEKLGNDSKYYRGENGYSDDLTSLKSSTIKKYLSDMIWGTSVTIVILSPNMKYSNWIEWELQYSLRVQSRNEITSRANGIVAVIQKDKISALYDSLGINFDPYGWLKLPQQNGNFSYRKDLLFPVIYENRFNKETWADKYLPRDYIEIVTEESFLKNPNKYIDSAYEKSCAIDSYIIKKN